jgi:hypothetical protein
MKEDTQNGKLVSGMLNWRWLVTLPTWVLISRARMKSWKKYTPKNRQPTGLTSLSCHLLKVMASAGEYE